MRRTPLALPARLLCLFWHAPGGSGWLDPLRGGALATGHPATASVLELATKSPIPPPLTTQELPPAYPREPVSRMDYEEDAPAPSMVLERVRRNRTAVNYAEKAGDARSRPAEHISAVLAEADEQGIDLASMAKALHKRTESSEETPVPYGAVRQVLIGMLRSGRARRRVRVPPAVLPGDSESALRCLVLNTMQIDPDRAAPWSLEARPRPMRARARPPRHLPHASRARLPLPP